MASKNYVDKTGLLYIITKIKALLAGKVDKVSGKQLSTNDYTTAEKTKLSGIAEGANKYTHPTSAGNKHIPSGGASGQILLWSADGTAKWGEDKDTTYDVFDPATADAAGTIGLVPAPAAGAQGKYLRADGSWQAPPNTTYGAFKGSTASEAGGTGLVPAPAAGTQAKYLRADGTWQSPPNTTYSPATTAANGLMSSVDKTKLDGIAEGANKTTVDAALSSTSTNPVQNKAVNTALAAKAPLASPNFTGSPKAPTAAAGTNSTQIATTAFVVSAVSEAVADITSFGFEVVSALPAAGAKGVIYLMSNGGSGNNVYDEYIWVNSKFEKIGTTAVDLSGYMLTADLVAITTSEIDAMFA